MKECRNCSYNYEAECVLLGLGTEAKGHLDECVLGTNNNSEGPYVFKDGRTIPLKDVEDNERIQTAEDS